MAESLAYLNYLNLSPLVPAKLGWALVLYLNSTVFLLSYMSCCKITEDSKAPAEGTARGLVE